MWLTTRRLFTAILFIALFVMATREIADPDFWWHLRAGQFIVETRAIPHADIFSHTNAGRPWVMHEWLAEVFLYALFALGSFPALMLAFAAIITLAFAFVYARCAGKPYIAAFVLLLAALATAPTWGVRPQMISLLLTSVFLYVLERRRDALWILPLLMLLWVNLHSGYALGIVIIGVYLVGEGASLASPRAQASSVKFRVSRFSFDIPRAASLVPLALVLVACIAVVPLNPNGATMYVYPFETLTSRAMQTYIQEWFSPDFHLVEFQPLAWLLLATLAAMAFAGARLSLTQTLLLIGFGYAALRSARHIPIFALVAAPILAEQIAHIVRERATNEANDRVTRARAIVNWLLLVLVVAGGSVRVAMVVSNQRAVERAKFPADAVDFLRARPSGGTLYNAYGWGGYLIWRLYPETRVFIDGRADVYGDAFIEEVFLRAYRGEPEWRVPLDRYGVRVVLIEPDAPLALQLARDAAWREVYADSQAIIFEKK